eukprot:scaffold5868_cov120-Isochrysis_galbana.AAC.9
MPSRDSEISPLLACAVSLARPRVKTRGASSISLRDGAAARPSGADSNPASFRSTVTRGLDISAPALASRTASRSSEATMYCVHWSKRKGLHCSSCGSAGLLYSMRMRIAKVRLTKESPLDRTASPLLRVSRLATSPPRPAWPTPFHSVLAPVVEVLPLTVWGAERAATTPAAASPSSVSSTAR